MLLFFTGVELVAAASLECWLPYARDPEFAIKLQRLTMRLHETPDRPLVLMLGSSRTLLAFQAGEVRITGHGPPPLAFNYGLAGAGPLVELVCLRRLVAAGVRPDLLLVEILPPALNQAGPLSLEEVWIQSGRLTWPELVSLRPFHSTPQRLVRKWCRSRLVPWPSLQKQVQIFLDPDGPEPSATPPVSASARIDDHGWHAHFVKGITAQQRRYFWEIAQSQYRDTMGDFHLAEQPVQALTTLLALCRQEGIPVALVLMPEGTDFRALYPPPVRAGLDAFLTDLCRQWGLALIDARDWVSDPDLWDSHHALPSGAAVFTQRLAHDALEPLLRTLPRRSR
jgi:hypothetical protein